jgi:hypothetical protein
VTAEAAVRPECFVIGMVKGWPPAQLDDRNYGEFVDALHGLKRDDSAAAEVRILQLVIKGERRGY